MTTSAPAPPEGIAALASPPAFSVLIAAFQVSDCIGEAIASALAQTEPACEVIVCDDGSSDDLEAALAPYRERIVLIRKDNGGEASAKNAAARAARGDFVAILDADDIYLPQRLAALGALARARPDLDILTTDAYMEAGGQLVRRVYTPAWTFEVDDQRREILRRNFIFGNAAIRRQTLIAAGGFDESIRRTTDWECWIRLILSGSRAGAVLEPLAHYRVREASLSTDREGMLEGSLQTLRAALNHPQIRSSERAIAETTIDGLQLRLLRMRLSEALRARQRGVARHLAIALARHHRTPLPARLKAVGAAIAPGIAARLLSRRRDATWVGAGGTRVGRD